MELHHGGRGDRRRPAAADGPAQRGEVRGFRRRAPGEHWSDAWHFLQNSDWAADSYAPPRSDAFCKGSNSGSNSRIRCIERAACDVYESVAALVQVLAALLRVKCEANTPHVYLCQLHAFAGQSRSDVPSRKQPARGLLRSVCCVGMRNACIPFVTRHATCCFNHLHSSNAGND